MQWRLHQDKAEDVFNRICTLMSSLQIQAKVDGRRIQDELEEAAGTHLHVFVQYQRLNSTTMLGVSSAIVVQWY